MNSFKIVAKHPVYGVVAFTLDADDEKAAFFLWKRVVGNHRQWNLRQNTQIAGTTLTLGTQAQALIDREDL